MKATILLEHLKKHMSLLARVVPTQSQVPVLLNVLLEATGEGLFISATDLEMGVRIKIPAKIEQEGAVTVSGKHFTEVINSLTSARVTMELADNGLVMQSDEGKVILQTIPKEEFPRLIDEKGKQLYTFSPAEVQTIFSKLLFSVSADDSRPELTGIYLAQQDDYIDFVSTDGYRLSLKRLPAKNILPSDEGMIISARVIAEIMHIKDEKITMYVYSESNQVLFETTDILLIGRLIAGNFPNYERVIPESSSTKITVDRDEFAKAIRLSSIFARESANIVRIQITDKTLNIFSRSSGVGEGEIKLAITQEGENNDISFNVKFLNDLLRSVDDKDIEMGLNSLTQPAVFRVPGDKEFLHVIMPVRVQE